MSIELKVPAVGESVTEAMIGEWLVGEGDYVPQDEPVVLIETDKASMEIPAPESGILKKIVKKEGESAEIGEVIGYLEASERPAEPVAAADGEKTEKEVAAKQERATGEEPRVAPAARRVLSQANLEPSRVQATGPGGRLLKEDVLRHLEREKEGETKEVARQEPAKKEVEAEGARPEERVKMTPLRKTVARRLVEAQQTAALLTTFNEIDMSSVIELRKRHQDAFQAKHGVKVGFMSFFVKAVIEALKEVPGVNAELDGDEIVYRNFFDIGIAVGGGKGLVVPVIRNAERLSFAEVEKTIADFAVRARDGKLSLDELQGGTFTISNGGIYGSLLSTPIVNPPQSGILGMHKIQDRPVAVDGQVVIRPMMYVALTYDHRLVDGREAVTFLVKVKERIEDPVRILLEA